MKWYVSSGRGRSTAMLVCEGKAEAVERAIQLIRDGCMDVQAGPMVEQDQERLSMAELERMMQGGTAAVGAS